MSALDRTRPILALEASTPAGGVALFLPTGEVIARAVSMGAGAADGLFPAIEAVLQQAGLAPADVGSIVCGEGPGSFTSLRIAAALAKGLAHGLGIPLYAVPSLALVAAAIPSEAPSGTYLVHGDALRGERYVLAVRRETGIAVEPSGSLRRRSIDDLRADDAQWLVSSGVTPVGLTSAYSAVPDVRGLLSVRGGWLERPVDLASWEPLYGRLAEAQVKWEATHGRALPANGAS